MSRRHRPGRPLGPARVAVVAAAATASVAALVLLAPAAGAQTCNAASCDLGSGGTVTVTVPSVADLSVPTTIFLNANQTSTTGVLRVADFVNGYVLSLPVVLTAWSNAPWHVTIAESSAPSATPARTLSATQFNWASSSNGSCTATLGYVLLSTTVASVNAASQPRTTNAGTAVTVCFKTTLSWTADGPTTAPATPALSYTLPLYFGIAAP